MISINQEKDSIQKISKVRETSQELFAEYEDGFFFCEEIDWGKLQGDEI